MKNHENFPLYFISTAYLAVHLIPDLGAADVVGPQWFYISAVNLLVITYLFFKRNAYSEAIHGVFSQKFALLYGFFVAWAILSISYAINPTEAIVCLARLASTFFMYTNLAILLYKKDPKSYFMPISVLITLILCMDSFSLLLTFFKNNKTTYLDQNIFTLVGNNGNKNIMAASLLIKIPFAIYVTVRAKLIGRLFALLAIFSGTFALFILNTRSTLIGLAIILLIFGATTLYFTVKSGLSKALQPIALCLLPIAMAFFVANSVLENTIKTQGNEGRYGSVTKRINDITDYTQKESRLRLWGAGLDYISKNPLVGGGYGNWKLASIPYEREHANELTVPLHAHNDFIEASTDLGIIGGLAYLGLFLLAILFILRIWLKTDATEFHLFSTITCMALLCYFVDAFFNFPADRTSMQTMFAFTFSLLFAPASFASSPKTNKKIVTGYFILAFALMGAVVYINKQVYQSLKIQKIMLAEISDANPSMDIELVRTAFPKIPNLSPFAIPIKSMMARYEFRDQHFDKALSLLQESDHENPYISYNDHIRTAIYSAKSNLDSVSFYANRAFYRRPRSSAYFKNAIIAATYKQDTLELKKIFKLYTRFRPEGLGYSEYLVAMHKVKGKADKPMLDLLAYATKTFPQDSVLFMNTKNLLMNNYSQVDFGSKGAIAYQKGDYEAAANYFLQASKAEPENYTFVEDTGLSYYASKKYQKCIAYFDQAIQFQGNKSGKSHFFKAMALVQLGKNELACEALQIAKTRAYPDANTYIKSICPQ